MFWLLLVALFALEYNTNKECCGFSLLDVDSVLSSILRFNKIHFEVEDEFNLCLCYAVVDLAPAFPSHVACVFVRARSLPVIPLTGGRCSRI